MPETQGMEGGGKCPIKAGWEERKRWSLCSFSEASRVERKKNATGRGE